ncbi:MAG: hypothetical protein ACHP65_08075 [Legionellales bacterium]
MVSEPGHPGRSYRIKERKHGTPYLGPENWLKDAHEVGGSWWLAWHEWLVTHSNKRRVPAPTISASLPPAPGTYVLQK